METAHRVLRKGTFAPAEARDCVVLDFDGRHRRRILLTADSGRPILLDLPEAAHMRDGDALALVDGTLVRIVARAEPLLEIAAPDGEALIRIAWHLGNRHVKLQIMEGRLRIRADHVAAAMVRTLGGMTLEISAPFDPEGGAYAGEVHRHGVEETYPHA